jgi:hypothetical protein
MILLVLMAFMTCGRGAEANLSPEEFKATTLAKVAPYVQWPKAALPDAETRFVIGIFGTNAVEPVLRALLRGQKIAGRDVTVMTFPADTNALPRCHLLFVPAEHEPLWQSVNKDTTAFGLLTVGESDDFTRNGGVFNLLVNQRRLEISHKNARVAGLTIDSRLLKFARPAR